MDLDQSDAPGNDQDIKNVPIGPSTPSRPLGHVPKLGNDTMFSATVPTTDHDLRIEEKNHEECSLHKSKKAANQSGEKRSYTVQKHVHAPKEDLTDPTCPTSSRARDDAVDEDVSAESRLLTAKQRANTRTQKRTRRKRLPKYRTMEWMRRRSWTQCEQLKLRRERRLRLEKRDGLSRVPSKMMVNVGHITGRISLPTRISRCRVVLARQPSS